VNIRYILIVFFASQVLLGKVIADEADFFIIDETDVFEHDISDGNSESIVGYVSNKSVWGIDGGVDLFENGEAIDIAYVQTDLFVESKGTLLSTKNSHWKLGAKGEHSLFLKGFSGSSSYMRDHSLIIKDAYVDILRPEAVWLRIGNQILSWGDSQIFPVNDVVNPKDLRIPGNAELRDIREHVPAIMASVPFNGIDYTIALTYEAGHNRYADAASIFNPFFSFSEDGLDVIERSPEKNWEVAVKMDWRFPGGDFAIIASDINNNDFTPAFVDGREVFLVQDRLQTLGLSLNQVLGNWVSKFEGAFYFGAPLSSREGIAYFHRDLVRTMFNVTYSGWHDWSVSYEVNSQYVVSHDDKLREGNTLFGHVVNVRKTALNERLSSAFWYIDIDAGSDRIIRLDVDYELSRRFRISSGTVVYSSDSSSAANYMFRQNDSFHFSIKYTF